jgi:ABC-type oligopeptide transport system substrate-binding subunit
VHHYRKQETECVDDDVPLAPIYLLAAVVAAWPPFSVVFTDWLSMIPALG